MTGYDNKHAGIWNSSSRVVRSAMESGPIVLFNTTKRGEDDILILSPFSRFMSTSLNQRDNQLEYGVMGSIVSIPENYNHSMIIFYSSRGINEGIREWGQTMQKVFNRTNKHRLNDVSINYLGYYTDNGGYYYYHTEDGRNYEETMIDIVKKIQLPFHYVEIGSWWYYKGQGEGVYQWIARPDIFPNGLPSLNHKIGNLPMAAHNRYWSYDTIYKQNYSFILDEKNSKSLPIGNDSFWFDLFNQSSQWGLILYEQDWLITVMESFTPIQTDIHLGYQWLTSMGQSADQLNINIQYSMSLPRHILSALEIPRVTQTRVSSDYTSALLTPPSPQWSIGITSIFTEAIGLAPFKDVFWSTSIQRNNPYGELISELLPDRAILISTLSTGPVASGDGINYTNIERIMKCCRQDGLILKPDHPLTMINALISDWALFNSDSQGELYSTRTTISNQTFHIVFASSMKQDYQVSPSMVDAQSGLAWSYQNPKDIRGFSAPIPIDILADQCHNLSICLWYISPLISLNDLNHTQYALLGELNKWTSVSQQRFKSIVIDNEKHQSIITIEGIQGELVPVLIFHSVLQSIIVNCTIISSNNQSTILISPSDIVCL